MHAALYTLVLHVYPYFEAIQLMNTQKMGERSLSSVYLERRSLAMRRKVKIYVFCIAI